MSELVAARSGHQVNSLDASLVFGIQGPGSIECRTVRIPVLPWLERQGDIQETVSGAVERRLAQFWSENRPSIESCWDAESDSRRNHLLWHWNAFGEEVVEELQEQLGQYEIDVGIELDVTLEQHHRHLHEPGALPDWVAWEPFQEILERNGRELAGDDVSLVSNGSVVFSPDPEADRPRMDIDVPSKLLLQEIRLQKEGQPLVRSGANKTLKPDSPETVRLPALPVSCYHLVRNDHDDEKTVQVKLSFLGGGEALLEVPIEVPRLDAAPVALFIDLGSTTSKMARVRLDPLEAADEVPNDFDAWSARELRRKLGAGNVDSSVALAFGPEPTQDFTSFWNLPAYDKSHLVEQGEEALADWFARATRAFAAGMVSKDKPLTKIYWSFPAVSSVNIEELRRKVKSASSKWMLGTPEVVTEHEALAARYEDTLRVLAEAANRQRREHEAAKKKNQKVRKRKRDKKQKWKNEKQAYEKKNFISRFFSSEPEKPNFSKYSEMPVPELEAWHQRFLGMSVSSRLDEFVIIDAGGFTLDIYVKRRGRDAKGHSVPAGGEDLTRRVRDYIAERRKGGEEDLWALAEREKRNLCVMESDSTLGRELRAWTRQIYETPVDELLQRMLAENADVVSRGIPLVLTGGGVKNPWLLELLEKKIEQIGFQSVKVNSESLSEEVVGFGLDDGVLERFRLATRGFAPDKNKVDIRFDMVGGLVEKGVRNSGW